MKKKMKARKAARMIKARPRYAWGKVHWDDQDVAIARQLGCTREAVRQKRRILGVGKSSKWHCRQGCSNEKIAALETAGMTLKQIAAAADCSVSYALQCVAKGKKGYTPEVRRGRPKYDWTKADWTLTDEGVARLLGIRNPGVVSQYRFRHNIWKRGVKANVLQKVAAVKGV